jgi:hypothetical protein
MRLLTILIAGWLLSISNTVAVEAHTDGAMSVHEITQESAPTASFEIKKDPTGGFNIQVVTENFVWRPEMASMQHVPGEGHAHVFLDGRKIMRIYNPWFHLNTYQFATRSGEQLLSIEFVGNDHAAYTSQGLPVGTEQVLDVPKDEIQPVVKDNNRLIYGLILVMVILLTLALIKLHQTARVGDVQKDQTQ